MARIVFKENCVEKAKWRIALAFDHFDTIVCTLSSGKDSLANLHLCLSEAIKRERKVHCVFLDQEAEWEATITEINRWMQHPAVVPFWVCAPFTLINSLATMADKGHYLIAHDPDREKEWVHPRNPIAIYEWPKYIQDVVDSRPAGTVVTRSLNGRNFPNFYTAMDASTYMAHKGKTAILGGIRANESLGRLRMCTHKIWHNIDATCTPKWDPFTSDAHGSIRMHPIYDWKESDVWRYIYENKLPYNALYDKMYQVGVSPKHRRVSSVCHELALCAISIFAEVEPQTWDRMQKRLSGANSMHNLGASHSECPAKFPDIFSGWAEYRDYLFEVMVPEDKKPQLATVLARLNKCMGTVNETRAIKCQITTILTLDTLGVKIAGMTNALFNPIIHDKGIELGQQAAERARQQGVAVVTDTTDGEKNELYGAV